MDVVEKGMNVVREVRVGREGGLGRRGRCLRRSVEVVCDGNEGGMFPWGERPYRVVFHDELQGSLSRDS